MSNNFLIDCLKLNINFLENNKKYEGWEFGFSQRYTKN